MSALLQYERGVSDNNSMFVNQRVNEARQMRGMSNLTKNNIQEAFRNQLMDFGTLFGTLKSGAPTMQQTREPAPSTLQGIIGSGTMIGSLLGGLGSILGQ